MSNTAYRADIDGLRALAVALVVGYHAFPRAIPGGFVGVDVFFVISGYLISGLILKALASESFSFRDFYFRRIRRIFPALVAVLVGCYLAGWFFLLPFEFKQLGKHFAGGAGFVSNFVLSGETDYFDLAAETKPLLHLWSLGIEEQFYIVWPLFLLLLHRSRLSPLRVIPVVFGASLVYCLVKSGSGPGASFAYYSPFTRFWELMMGCGLAAAALEPARRRNSWAGALGVLLILIAAFTFGRADVYPGWRALLPTSGTLLLIAAGPEAWLNRKLFSLRPIVGLGLISYSLYLWHWPILVFALLIRSQPPGPTLLALAILLALALACATYFWIERPIRQFQLGPKPVFALASAMAALGGLGLWTFSEKGLPSRMNPMVRAITEVGYTPVSDPLAEKCWLTQESPSIFPAECIGPASKALPLLVLWGDSHAGRFLPGIRKAFGGGFRIGGFMRNICPPGIRSAANTECNATNLYVFSRIVEAKPEIVVMYAAWNRYNEAWAPEGAAARDLKMTIRELKRAGVLQVILIGPPNQWKDSLPRLLLRNWRQSPWRAPPERLSDGIEPLASVVDRALESLSSSSGALYFSAYRAMCDQSGCLTKYGPGATDLMTWDYGHLTPGGAEFLAKGLPIR